MENFPNTILSPSHAQITEKISAELFNSALSCLVVATNCTGDHQQSFQLDVDTDEMEFISFVVLKVIDESRANFGKFSKFSIIHEWNTSTSTSTSTFNKVGKCLRAITPTIK